MNFFDDTRISYSTTETCLAAGKEYVFQIHVPLNKSIMENGNQALGRVSMPRVNTERVLRRDPSLEPIRVLFVQTAKFPKRAYGYVRVKVVNTSKNAVCHRSRSRVERSSKNHIQPTMGQSQ